MSPEFLNDSDASPSSADDSRAFAVAHAVVEALTRLFFSGIPFLFLWQAAAWDWATALVVGTALGYGLEAILKRVFEGDDED